MSYHCKTSVGLPTQAPFIIPLLLCSDNNSKKLRAIEDEADYCGAYLEYLTDKNATYFLFSNFTKAKDFYNRWKPMVYNLVWAENATNAVFCMRFLFKKLTGSSLVMYEANEQRVIQSFSDEIGSSTPLLNPGRKRSREERDDSPQKTKWDSPKRSRWDSSPSPRTPSTVNVSNTTTSVPTISKKENVNLLFIYTDDKIYKIAKPQSVNFLAVVDLAISNDFFGETPIQEKSLQLHGRANLEKIELNENNWEKYKNESILETNTCRIYVSGGC